MLFTHGVTLGLRVLAAARETVVLMTGAAKRDAAASVLFRPEGLANPAAALRRCGRVTVLLDPEAAPETLPQWLVPSPGGTVPPVRPAFDEAPLKPLPGTTERVPELVEQGP